MLEIINSLDRKRLQKLDNFFTYFGMYEDTRRSGAIKRLLRDNRTHIEGKVCVEAGAGLGDITWMILRLNPHKLFCVEENPLCCRYLKNMFKNDRRVEVVNSRIEDFRPGRRIDFMFQEFYGPMLLDESLLCLERLKFRPEVLAPNEGYLLYETADLKTLKDPLIDKQILGLLKGALITDLFIGYKFKNPKRILKWKFGENMRTDIIIKPKTRNDILVFGMEIWHNNKRQCGTAECENWPYVFTPAKTGKLNLSFIYRDCYSEIRLK
jgi:hypothetical protein